MLRPRNGRRGGRSADAARPETLAEPFDAATGIDDLLTTIPSLQRSDLEGWIRDELVIAERDAGLSFSDMECARIRLICTLTYELEIDSGALPVVLSLLDQLYETRQRLFSLTRAVTSQDKAIQAAIVAAMSPGDNFTGTDQP